MRTPHRSEADATVVEGAAPHPDRSEVVVVGAGAIGLASAWQLVEAGAAVVVCDPEPGAGSSWAAGGMLPPATEADFGEVAHTALNVASASRWPVFAEQLGEAAEVDVGYRRLGSIVVARDADEVRVLERLAELHQRLGLRSRRVRSSEARDIEPGLAPRTRGGLECPDDAIVDNRALVEALRRAVEAAGAPLVRSAVTEVLSDGDQVTGVALADGTRIACEHVVVAAGHRSAALQGIPVPVPVRPVKGQILHLRPRKGEPMPVSRLVRGLGYYLVPHRDRLVVGATVEERHLDRTVTAGGVLQLLREAWEAVPDVTELELLEATAGLRPATPDNGPMIGPAGVSGLVLACGHWRNGILLTPITAEAVRALVTGEPPPEEVAPFTPQRFTDSDARRDEPAGAARR